MVSEMESGYRFSDLDERELDGVLVGRKGPPRATRLPGRAFSNLEPGRIGVISVDRDRLNRPIRPVALVVLEEDQRRLFGRYAQLRSDLSPITAWCHLLSPRYIDGPASLSRIPN